MRWRNFAAGLLLGAVLGALVTWLVMRERGAGRAVEGTAAGTENWTHKELRDHLAARGLDLTTEAKHPFGTGTAGATFRDPSRSGATGPLSVYVGLFPDHRAAVEFAGTDPHGFAWGRFGIVGNEQLVADVRARLE